ncbi:hypothetical protein RQP46_007820 [Phenoliferia psychrophenolica]
MDLFRNSAERIEVIMSLRLGISSTVSPSIFKACFPPARGFNDSLDPLSEEELQTAVSLSEESAKKYDALVENRFLGPADRTLTAVTRRLAFCPSGASNRVSAVRESWHALQAILEYFKSSYAQIQLVYRTRLCRLSATLTRPALTGSIHSRWYLLIDLLCGCHTLLRLVFEDGGTLAEEMWETSMRILDSELVGFINALESFMEIKDIYVLHELEIGRRLAALLVGFPLGFLPRWCGTYTKEANV